MIKSCLNCPHQKFYRIMVAEGVWFKFWSQPNFEFCYPVYEHSFILLAVRYWYISDYVYTAHMHDMLFALSRSFLRYGTCFSSKFVSLFVYFANLVSRDLSTNPFHKIILWESSSLSFLGNNKLYSWVTKIIQCTL